MFFASIGWLQTFKFRYRNLRLYAKIVNYTSFIKDKKINKYIKQNIYIYFLIFFFLLLLGCLFVKYSAALVKLVHLKFNNEVVNAKVLDIYKRGRIPYMVVKYVYEYDNQKQTGKSVLSFNIISSFNFFLINKYLHSYPYKINDDIKLLINNYYKFPKSKINYEIFITLVYIILLGALIVYYIIAFLKEGMRHKNDA
ncbi:MAG: hypothetical protein LBC53_08770 [Spirochaetaceae bacterium]|jgi:hypothetical protein|nr:hypothetical protein [Spirochaetaceae bacterium]